MCLVEEKKGNNAATVLIGMIIICPSTGDVVWDDFEGMSTMIVIDRIVLTVTPLSDTGMRLELEVLGFNYLEPDGLLTLSIDTICTYKTC